MYSLVASFKSCKRKKLACIEILKGLKIRDKWVQFYSFTMLCRTLECYKTSWYIDSERNCNKREKGRLWRAVSKVQNVLRGLQTHQRLLWHMNELNVWKSRPYLDWKKKHLFYLEMQVVIKILDSWVTIQPMQNSPLKQKICIFKENGRGDSKKSNQITTMLHT